MKTNLVINSFPRTGNTYLQQNLELFLKKNNLSNIDFNSHLHDHELLLNKKINQVCIYRNPKDTISSLILMLLNPGKNKEFNSINIEELVDEELKLYINFYHNAFNSNNLCLIDFEYLISSNINDICFYILKYFNIQLFNNIALVSKDEIDKNIETNLIKHSNNLYLINYPKKIELPEKDKIKKIISNSKYYSNSLIIYNKIKNNFLN